MLDQPQERGGATVNEQAIETAKRHLRDCMEAPDWPVHNCYATCNDLNYLLAQLATLAADPTSLLERAEAQNARRVRAADRPV